MSPEEVGPGHTPKSSTPEPIPPERRSFLAKLSITLGSLAAVLIAIPFIGVVIAPARRREPDIWRPVGRVEDFAIGHTTKVQLLDPAPLPWAGFSAETAVYVRRIDAATVAAFSLYCTHTGCPVQWVEDAGLFFCPCHGGAFHRDGRVAAGPPPRPLPRHEARIRNGTVEVRTRPVPLPPPRA